MLPFSEVGYNNIVLELALATTIKSLKVNGVFRATDAVKAGLSDRIIS